MPAHANRQTSPESIAFQRRRAIVKLKAGMPRSLVARTLNMSMDRINKIIEEEGLQERVKPTVGRRDWW
jgi:hypothetical protein